MTVLGPLVTACTGVALLTLLSVTSAATEGDPATDGSARLERVAEALRRSPLFVDADVADVLAPADRPPVLAAMEAAGVPVFVAAVPFSPDDESEGSEAAFLHALHERLGRDGVYMAVNERSYIDVVDFAVPRDTYYDIDLLLGGPPERGHLPLATRLLRLLDVVRQSPPAPPTVPVPPEPPRPIGAEDRDRRDAALSPLGFAIALVVAAVVAGPLTALLVAASWAVVVALWRALTSPRRDTDSPAIGDPDAPAKPGTTRLARLADQELRDLAAALGQGDDGSAGRTQALEAYDAAAVLHREVHEDPVPLLAVCVLAQEGRAALGPRRPRFRAPCFVNPLHGPARRTRTLRIGDTRRAGVPVCDRCFHRSDAERLAAFLHLDWDGLEAPYTTFPGLFGGPPYGTTNPRLAARALEHLGVR